jgi:hypothetical protein
VRIGSTRRAARAAVRWPTTWPWPATPTGPTRCTARGVEHLPPRHRRTVWEEWWCRSVDGGPAALRLGTRPSGGQRIIGGWEGPRGLRSASCRPRSRSRSTAGPWPERRPGQARPDTGARPSRTAHVERASDVLWPDAALAVTRARLSSLVQRLRRVLGAHGEAVIRSGDLLVLDDGRCGWTCGGSSRPWGGDRDERREALLSVRGTWATPPVPVRRGLRRVPAPAERGSGWRHAGRAHRGGEGRPGPSWSRRSPRSNLTTADLHG